MRKSVFAALLFFAAALFTGCDTVSESVGGFQTIGGGEHAVVFSALPRLLGGGIEADRILRPGEKELVLPWERLYRLDTTVQSIGWGGMGQGNDGKHEDYVETRTLDGNEVLLAVTIQYHISPEKLGYIVQHVGTTNESIRQLISAAARADIRTHTNTLKTQGFFQPNERDKAVARVKASINERLNPEGIIVDDVIYVDHRFERRLADGSSDHAYQEQIDSTQAMVQEIQKEEKNVHTVEEQKRREFNETQAVVNRKIEEAEGYRRQAQLRGDGYLKRKRNEAEQISVVGNAEVEGLKKQIEAMSGPGGRALLRIAIAKELIKKNPNFVLVNSANGEKGGIDLNRIDTNELLRQAGVFAIAGEAARDGKKAPDSGSTAESGAGVPTPADLGSPVDPAPATKRQRLASPPSGSTGPDSSPNEPKN